MQNSSLINYDYIQFYILVNSKTTKDLLGEWLMATAATPKQNGGMASRKAPNPPAMDRTLACITDLTDRTRWKYTCHGMVPSV